MKNKKTFYNTVGLAAGRAGQMGIGMLVSLVVARCLGPEDFGLLQYAGTYSGFFAAFCSLGIPSVLVKLLTDQPEREGEILGTAFFLQGAGGILSALGMILAAYVLETGNRQVLAVIALSGAGMCLQCVYVFREWLSSRLRFGILAAIGLAACGIGAVYKLYLLGKGLPIAWFALAAAVENLAALGLFLAAYGALRGGKLTLSREMAGAILRRSCHFILPGLMVSIYAQTDKWMLGRLLGQTQTGYYSCAVSVCSCWCFLLTAIIDAMGAEITRAHKANREQFLHRNRQLYAMVFYLAAAVSAGICLGAEPLVKLLFGPGYLPAAKPLRVITWYTGFSYLGVARNVWVVCEERQKYLIWVYLAAAISNVLLNGLLIPRWGTAGAAAASLASQVITTMIVPFFIKGLRENSLLMLQAVGMPFRGNRFGR